MKTEAYERSESARKILDSAELFTGAKEIVIRHKNDYYRLLITKAGKLILNK